MKKIIIILFFAVISISACFSAYIISGKGHSIDKVSQIDANLNLLASAINKYIDKTHQLPSWGDSFVADLQTEHIIEDGKIIDSLGGNFVLTISDNGASLVIASAGKDRVFGTRHDINRILNINPKRFEPVVTTPVESGKVQGTADHP